MPERYDTTSDHPFVSNGILEPSQLFDHIVSAGHRLADMAKAGGTLGRACRQPHRGRGWT
jgi:hypothetical protein